jgi:hypothetical protein
MGEPYCAPGLHSDFSRMTGKPYLIEISFRRLNGDVTKQKLT